MGSMGRTALEATAAHLEKNFAGEASGSQAVLANRSRTKARWVIVVA